MMMSLPAETADIRRILHDVEEKLCEYDDTENMRDNFTKLMCLLDSPLFMCLVNVDEALHTLQDVSHRQHITENDFDIDVRSGNIKLSSDQLRNLGVAGQHHVNNIDRHNLSISPTNADTLKLAGRSRLWEGDESHVQSFISNQLETIVLDKPSGPGIGLGFGIVGLRNDSKELGVFIQDIQPEGVAGRDGRLRENDQIIAINNQQLNETAALKQAVQLLQSAVGKVSLHIAHGGLNESTLRGSVTTMSPTSLQQSPFDLGSSELLRLEVIDLYNDGSGLGFGIISGRSGGVIIKTIVPDGIADQDGRLKSGDRILQIGDTDVRDMNTEGVATVLRQSGVHVRLIVARQYDADSQSNNDHDSPLSVIALSEQMNEAFERLRRQPIGVNNNTSEMESQPELPSRHLLRENKSFPSVEIFEVQLVKDQQGLGITIAGYTDQNDGTPKIFVNGITEGSVASMDGRIRVSDQIIAVDNQSLEGFNNQQALDVLRGTGQIVNLKMARYLIGAHYEPVTRRSATSEAGTRSLVQSVYMNSLDDHFESIDRKDDRMQTDDDIANYWQSHLGPGYHVVVAHIVKPKTGGGLGISLEGKDQEGLTHHYVHTVLPDGPVGINGLIQAGDELLEVNGNHLAGLIHKELVAIMEELPQQVYLVSARLIEFEDMDDDADTLQVPYAGSLSMLDSSSERLVKARSEQMLNRDTDIAALDANRSKSKSLDSLSLFGNWRTEPIRVELNKTDKGLGFSILDYPDSQDPMKSMIIIRSLVSGGAADLDGRLEPGDRLVFVNGVSLYNASLEAAVQTLMGLPRGVVRLTVLKPERIFGESNTDIEQDTAPPLHALPPSSFPDLSPSPPLITSHQQTASERLIELIGSGGSLGLSVNSLKDDGDPGCVITSIDPDGRIAKDGRLAVGDILLEMNNENFRNVTSAQARSIVRRLSLVGTADMRITYLPSTVIKHDSPHGTTVIVPTLILSTSAMNQATEESSTLSHLMITPLSVPMEKSRPSADQRIQSGINSALPSACSWGPPHLIEISRKEGESLGISIIGGYSELMLPTTDNSGLSVTSGIYIKLIKPDSPAGRNGEIQTGDRILEVNGVDLRNATHDQAADVIRNASSPVQFLLQSLVSVSESPGDTRSLTLSGFKKAMPVMNYSSSSDSSEEEEPMSAPSNNSKSHWDKILKRYGDLDGELHVVDLNCDVSNGLGVDLAGNRNLDTMSVFISAIHPNGAVARDGRIRVGDELLEINEQVIYGRSHLNATSIIKSITAPLKTIVLLRRNDFGLHMAGQIKKTDKTLTFRNDPDTLVRPVQLENGFANGKMSPLTVLTTDAGQSALELESFDNVTIFCLEKGDRGFGFAIEELTLDDGRTGLFVKTITPNGPAEEEGTLSVGDRLLMVEDTSLVDVRYNEALSILRHIEAGSTVQLTVSKRSLNDRFDDDSGGSEQNVDDVLLTSPLIIDPVVNTESSPLHSATPQKSPSHKSEIVEAAVQEVHTTPPPQRVPLVIPVIHEDPSACSIEAGRETTIEIQKGKTGLGLSIIGGSDTLLGGIVIHEVYENGAAARDGRLCAGDQILEVCGQSLRNVTHEMAIQALRQTPSVIKLVILREETDILADANAFDTIVVNLVKKPGQGLGFSIIGRSSGVFISEVVKEGVADADGRLMHGDHIVGLNGIDMTDATQENVAEFLKTSMGAVSIIVRRLKAGDGSTRTQQRRESNLSSPGGSGLMSVGNYGMTKSPSNTSGLSSSSTTPLVVELTRHERGLLKLQLSPDVLASELKRYLVIVDLFGTGKAIGDKLQVYDKILSINGMSTDGLSELEALQMIKSSTDSVLITVLRGQHVTSQEIMHDSTAAEADADSDSEDAGTNSESVKTVTLQRGPQGFGFSIVGGLDSQHGSIPLYIKSVFPDSPAAMTGRLKRGDQLLSVNGQSLHGFTHDQAVAVLKQSQGSVVLTLLG